MAAAPKAIAKVLWSCASEHPSYDLRPKVCLWWREGIWCGYAVDIVVEPSIDEKDQKREITYGLSNFRRIC